MANRQNLTEAYHRLTSITMNNAGKIASDEFLKLGSWREADIQRYTESVLPGMDNAKRTMANYTSGYYGRIAAAEKQAFKAVSVPATELATQAIRNGTTAEMIWQRPFKEMWTELGKGANFSDALNAGARRADWTARTEVQLAKRQAGLSVRNGNSNIVGYLRTLSGAENCGLCYLASTQRYNRGNLLPIHPGCDCGETPIYGNTDVGQVVDEETLNATHEAVSDRFGKFDVTGREIDYRQITIVDHGELGPYLTVKGHEFTKVKPQNLKTVIKAPKPVPASVKTTFAETIRPKLSKISATRIADDIKLEHGDTYVPNLVGKKKVQTLGEKTAGHLEAVKAVGKDIDTEISHRVKKAISDLVDPKEIAFAESQIKLAENLVAKTQLQYEAGVQGRIALERAKIEARAAERIKSMRADGFDQAYLDNWYQTYYSPEKVLTLAAREAEQYFKFEPAGRKLLDEIKGYKLDIAKYQETIPANMIPGSVKYNQIFASKTKEVLSEVRELGNGGPKFVGSSKANEVLEEARQIYPSGWLAKAQEEYEVIGTKAVSRGYFSRFSSEIAISFDKAQGFTPGYATAVHEMGHMFEDTITGLRQLEFAFAHQRAALNPKRSNLGAKETGFDDRWRMTYTGKDYGYNVDSSYEIFTTGIESVFSGSNHFMAPTNSGSRYINKSLPSNIPMDDEFRQFVLGVLFSL